MNTLSRRSLLAMVPAASALLALRSKAAPIPAAAVTPAGFGISVQCWSFKNFTLFEAIEKAAAAGAGGVEMFPGQRIGGPHGDTKLEPGIAGEIVRSILDKLNQHGIAAMNFGVTGLSKDEDECRKTFELGKQLGLYGITTESLDAIDTIEKLSKEYDIKVGFHNHPRPTSLWNPETIWKVIEKRDKNIGYCADLGHWAASGLDPLETIKKVAPRVVSFHMKDREKVGGPSHDRPFGTGVIDLIAILDQVREHGFAGNVTIEYEHHWDDNVAEIAQCVGYLRAYSKARA